MPTLSFILMMLMIFICSTALPAQEAGRKQIRRGNNAFEKGNYQNAEEYYRKALGRDAGKFSLHGQHNLGNALYKQGKFSEAYDHLRLALDEKQDSSTINKLWYNFGNSALQKYLNVTDNQKAEMSRKFLNQSIQAYSKALQYAPEDEDARHNLTLALMMKQIDSQQQEKQKEEQHTLDKQKHEQYLPETSLTEEERDINEPEHQEGNISREDAERMLNAIREKEMKTAEQIHERERRRTATGKIKDW